jgi:hypothetical protein
MSGIFKNIPFLTQKRLEYLRSIHESDDDESGPIREDDDVFESVEYDQPSEEPTGSDDEEESDPESDHVDDVITQFITQAMNQSSSGVIWHELEVGNRRRGPPSKQNHLLERPGRKICQIRNFNGSMAKLTCNSCNKFTCGICTFETIIICKNCKN